MTQFKIEDMEKGIIPQELNIITAHITDALKFSRRVRAYLAVLITQGRREYFADDVTGWIDWCKEQGVADADIHPLRQAGDLLLDILPHDLELYERLFLLDTEKSRAIGRLKAKVTAKLTLIDVVQKFLTAYPPEKLNREKVRRCVAFCLGEVDSLDIPEEAAKAKSGKWQPDMFDAIDVFLAVDDDTLDMLHMDERFDSAATAKYYKSGMVLVENAINYLNIHGGNPEVIATAEHQLRDQADKLAEIRERMALKEVG